MKRWLIALILFGQTLYADDKVEHFTVSYAMAYTCSVLTKEPVACMLASLGVGIIKETVIDRRVSEGDLYFDSLGVGLAFIVYQF